MNINIVPAFIRRRLEHRPGALRIIDNISWLFFDKILRMGVGLLVGVWVARYLGPEQFGLLSFAIAFASLFGAFVVLGLPSIVVRDIVRDPGCKEVTLGTAAVLQLMGGFFSYAVILASILWLRSEDPLARTIVAIVGGGLLFKASDVVVYWFESQVQSKYIVWAQNSVFIVFAVIKIFLILKEASITAFAWAVLGEAAIASIFVIFIMNARAFTLKKLEPRWGRAKELLADSWPLLLSSVAVTLYMKVDQIMLALMEGDEAAGIYSAAIRVSEIWYFVPIAICASIFPSMLAMKKNNTKIYYERLQYLFDAMVWLSLSVALVVTFLSSWIVALLFGEAYMASGSVLAIHVWGAVFVFLGVASSQWFLAENLQMLSLQRTILGLIINVLGNIILIPICGASGAALSTVLSQAVAAWFSDALQARTRVLFVMKARSFNPASMLNIFKRFWVVRVMKND
ncbi:flippase [Pseudomonas chengduensis]